MLIVYHPKAVFAPVSVVLPSKPVGLPLELTPVAGADGLAFLVTEAGKPVPEADVLVYAPGEARPKPCGRTSTG